MKLPELNAIGYSNIRNHQIGIDGTDGITVEVAEDIGFESEDQIRAILRGENTERPQDMRITVAADAGQIICGDCSEVIPCQHTDGTTTFGN
jgi:hypothetical protein